MHNQHRVDGYGAKMSYQYLGTIHCIQTKEKKQNKKIILKWTKGKDISVSMSERINYYIRNGLIVDELSN